LKLFGTDGVRGFAGEFLSAELSLKLGMAAGIYFRKNAITNKILVGKDTRRSGYMIENALVSGLTAVGFNVVQIGPMPTPAIAFLTEDMRCDAGIMISASHNPYYDNGIKFFDNNGDKLNTQIEEEIEKIFYDDALIRSALQVNGDIGKSKRVDDVIGRYIVQIKNSFPKEMTLKSLRVVLDCANGAAYKVAPTIFKELGAEIIVLSNEPNGFNINEDCGALHPERLAQTIKEYRADIGFAFDGDADRLVVVDEKGEVIDGDNLLGALAVYMKKCGRLKGSQMVATVMSNQGLEDYLKKHHIELLRSAVGDKNVLEVMQQEEATLGGEQSGHVIVGDYAKTGDGLASALQVVALLRHSGKSASEALHPFELYPSTLHNIKVKEKKPFDTLVGYKELVENIESKGLRTLVRYSGTENKLRLLVEGKNQKDVTMSLNELIKFFEKELND
jgi:phosphoglucosamine mutase